MVWALRSSIMMTRQTLGFLLFFFAVASFYSCNDHYAVDQIPITYVEKDINLTNVQYANLWNDGGWVYLDGEGYRGLIIYHPSGNEYRVFERACPYDPRSDCDPVTVDSSGLFMTHPCCKSTFNFDGQPSGGPADLPLRQYHAYLDSNNMLLIRSE